MSEIEQLVQGKSDDWVAGFHDALEAVVAVVHRVDIHVPTKDRFDAVKKAVERGFAEIVEQLDIRTKKAELAACGMCKITAEHGGPPHEPSSLCHTKGIRPHCTCRACFG